MLAGRRLVGGRFHVHCLVAWQFGGSVACSSELFRIWEANHVRRSGERSAVEWLIIVRLLPGTVGSPMRFEDILHVQVLEQRSALIN